jgi:hypothetical protein
METVVPQVSLWYIGTDKLKNTAGRCRSGPRQAPVYKTAEGYTGRVVRFLWGVTLVAFILLVGGDKICCPDGCTDRSNGTASTESVPHDAPHTCVLCVLGVEAADAPRSDAPAGVVSSVGAALTPSLPNGMPLSLDHPPRRA